ncbi:MAG: polysaccharide deacetylase family protein [Aggregatilineales bacterium]
MIESCSSSRLSRRTFLKRLGILALGVALPQISIGGAEQPFRVPPTLMFHTKDRWKLPRILDWLREHDYESVGYRDLLKALHGERALPEKPIILTIDDIAPGYIQPYFLAMAEEVEKVGYRGVFAVVADQPPYRAQSGWATLRALAERGWELDTHTSYHSYLPALKLPDLRDEIIRSAQWIAEGTGCRPLSLIVPYGGVYRREREFDQRIFEVSVEAHLSFVVGIVGGRFISPEAQPPYYVGRIGIGSDHLQTGRWIQNFHQGS